MSNHHSSETVIHYSTCRRKQEKQYWDENENQYVERTTKACTIQETPMSIMTVKRSKTAASSISRYYNVKPMTECDVLCPIHALVLHGTRMRIYESRACVRQKAECMHETRVYDIGCTIYSTSVQLYCLLLPPIPQRLIYPMRPIPLQHRPPTRPTPARSP